MATICGRTLHAYRLPYQQVFECREKGIGASCDRAHNDMIRLNFSYEISEKKSLAFKASSVTLSVDLASLGE